MDSEVEVAAVKFVLGGHLAAVTPGRGGLSVCDVQLKQVDLWAGEGMTEDWGRSPAVLKRVGVAKPADLAAQG